MAEQTAKFTLELEDDVSGAAEAAATGLGKLRDALDADTKALAGMQRAMKNIQGGAAVNVAEFRKLKAGIDAKKQSIATAQSNYLALGGSFTKASTGAKSFAQRIAEVTGKNTPAAAAIHKTGAASHAAAVDLEMLGKHAGALPGPLGAMLGKFNGLKDLFSGGAITAGVMALVAGLVALVAATAAAVAALLKFGIANSEARRTELLHFEGLTKLRTIFGTLGGSAEASQAAIDKVTDSTALGRTKAAEYTEALLRMHVKGKNLGIALEGAAMRSVVFGDASAHAFMAAAAGAALTGRSVQAMTDRVRKQIGGIAAKHMLDLAVLSEKLHESFARLTDGLKLEAFAKSIQGIVHLFSQTTASGRALKGLFNTLFQPLVNGLTVGKDFKRFFNGMIIESQRIVIQFLLIRKAFKQAFRDAGVDVEHGTAALNLGKGVVIAFGVALAFAAGAAIAFAWPVLLAAAALWGLWEVCSLVYQLWDEIDWAELGDSIVQGMVNGLGGGLHKLVQKMKELATAAWSAFKETMGIASPSKVFADLGLQIPLGVVAGVEQGKPAANKAVAGVVAVPHSPSFPHAAADGGEDKTAAAGAARAPVTATVNIEQIHIHSDDKNAKNLAQEFARELESVLEGVAIQLGAQLSGGAT